MLQKNRKSFPRSAVLPLLAIFLIIAIPGSAISLAWGVDSASGSAMTGPVGTAFSYQGELMENGTVANGPYDFRFIIYDASAGGSQVGPTVTAGDVAVSEGLFTAPLDFGNIFDGTALWLEIAVRPGASTGSYNTLSPRQALTAAPYALSLVPGAVIDGDVSGSGTLNLSNDTGTGINIDSSGQDGIHIVNSDVDGVHIETAGDNGFKVDNATSTGLTVGTVGAVGVRVINPADTGFLVNNAGEYGVYVGDAGTYGLNVEHSDGDGVYICATGSQNSCPSNSGLNNGIEIGNVQDHGLYIDSATKSGVFISSSNSHGVEVNNVNGNGLKVFTANVGVDVAGSLAGFFFGDIQVTGSCTGCLISTFGVNNSSETLQPGDLLTIQGMRPSGVDSVPALMEVALAGEGDLVVGVVQGGAELQQEQEPRPTEIGRRLIPQEGVVEPDGYVTVVLYGPIQIQAGETAETIIPGAKLTIDNNGNARILQTVVVDGVTLAESAPVIGIALSEPDEAGLVWILLNPQ